MRDLPLLLNDEMVRRTLDGSKTQTRRVVKPPNGICFNHDYDILRYDADEHILYACEECNDTPLGRCPYGQPGDRLWVREAWRPITDPDIWTCVTYRADGARVKPRDWTAEQGAWCEAQAGEGFDEPGRWRPSIHMPRWASRISLDVVSVRVERVQEITEEDARAEGMALSSGSATGQRYYQTWRDRHCFSHVHAAPVFAVAWDAIYAGPQPCYTRDAEGRRVITHYVSYPWDGTSETRVHRGKPWHVYANPWVWVIGFRRIEA